MILKENFPKAFFIMRDELGLTDLHPWMIMQDELIIGIFEGLKERYPYKRLYPFAKNDDYIACFNESKQVVVFKDYASKDISKIIPISLNSFLKKIMNDFIICLDDEVEYIDFINK